MHFGRVGITETALAVEDKKIMMLMATYLLAACFYLALIEATNRWWKED